MAAASAAQLCRWQAHCYSCYFVQRVLSTRRGCAAGRLSNLEPCQSAPFRSRSRCGRPALHPISLCSAATACPLSRPSEHDDGVARAAASAEPAGALQLRWFFSFFVAVAQSVTMTALSCLRRQQHCAVSLLTCLLHQHLIMVPLLQYKTGAALASWLLPTAQLALRAQLRPSAARARRLQNACLRLEHRDGAEHAAAPLRR